MVKTVELMVVAYTPVPCFLFPVSMQTTFCPTPKAPGNDAHEPRPSISQHRKSSPGNNADESHKGKAKGKNRPKEPPHPTPPKPSHRPGRGTSLTANMLTAHLIPLNNHHTATPPRLIPPLATPATIPAPIQRLERAPRQRALGQQGRQRGGGRVAFERGRHRVRDRLHG